MKLNNFKSIYSLANTLYGTTINPNNFEDIALDGWEKINTRHTRLYRYIADTEDNRIELPCNVSVIEAVHIPWEDAQMTSNTSIFPLIENQYYERYNEAWKWNKSPIYQRGKLVKYREEGNTLVFDRNYRNVVIVYHGVIVDDEGLPLITDREVQALAAYCAYVDLFKHSLIRKDPNAVQFAAIVKAEWLKMCSQARIPIHLDQNTMNDILDVKTRWDRKAYAKSYIPVL